MSFPKILNRNGELSEESKSILKEQGIPDCDFKQIAEAIHKTTYQVVENGKQRRISAEKAMEILGKERFLSGIARSAFHWNAVRVAGSFAVYFDSKKLFAE